MPCSEQEYLPEALRNTEGVVGDSLLLPVVPSTPAVLDEVERQRLREIVAQIEKREGALAATNAFSVHTRPGLSDKPWLVVGDTREITLTKPGHEFTYEYRLSLLARPGDLVVFSREPHYDFERYRTQQIGFGPIVRINVQNVPKRPMLPLAERCCLDKAAIAKIVEYVERAGGLTVFPQIGMGSAWRACRDHCRNDRF